MNKLSEHDKMLALARDNLNMIIPLLEKKSFSDRGLSERTIQALVDCGIDAPERLLFMPEDAFKKIPGIGAKSRSEISAYRARFLPK